MFLDELRRLSPCPISWRGEFEIPVERFDRLFAFTITSIRCNILSKTGIDFSLKGCLGQFFNQKVKNALFAKKWLARFESLQGLFQN